MFNLLLISPLTISPKDLQRLLLVNPVVESTDCSMNQRRRDYEQSFWLGPRGLEVDISVLHESIRTPLNGAMTLELQLRTREKEKIG